MLLALGFAGGEGGVVLCFGGDGHLAIEVVGPQGCDEAAEAAAPAASAIALPVSSSHCGPCVDVALTSPLATEGFKVARRLPSATSSIAVSELRPPVPLLRAANSYRQTTPFISEKPHTIVIRC
jgi:hypothetical protein